MLKLRYFWHAIIPLAVAWITLPKSGAAETDALPPSTQSQESSVEEATPLHQAVLASDRETVTSLLKEKAAVDSIDSNGTTPLMLACRKGDNDLVLMLSRAGADVNHRNHQAQTPIMWAAMGGNTKVIKSLLYREAKLGWVDRDGNEALFFAAQNGHLSAVKLITTYRPRANRRNRFGKTALSAAVESGHMAVARFLIRSNWSLQATDVHGRDVFMHAAIAGQVNVLEELKKKGADIRLKDRDRKDAFLLAAEAGKLAVVKKLLKLGADPAAQDIEGKTAVILAMERGHAQIAKYLKSKQLSKAPSPKGPAALIAAAKGGDTKIIRNILQAGIEALNQTDRDGNTALMWAVRKGQHAAVRLLSSTFHADINKANLDGIPPIAAAAQTHQPKMVTLLLDLGAEPKVRLPSGNTLLIEAALAKKPEIAGLLISGGADINGTSDDGTTVLMAAAVGGLDQFVSLLLSWGLDVNQTRKDGHSALSLSECARNTKISKILEEAGGKTLKHNPCELSAGAKHEVTSLMMAAQKGAIADVKQLWEETSKEQHHQTDATGRGALFYAVKSGNPDMVSLLAQKGLRIADTDNQGYTPLMLAAQLGHEDVVRELLRLRADEKKTTKYGLTPLMVAAKFGHVEIVRALLDKRTLHATDKNGWTALCHAVVGGHAAAAAKLIVGGAKTNIKDAKGNGLLILAAQSGNLDTLKVVLDGSSDVNQTADDGTTPMKAAQENGFFDLVQLLKKRGANPVDITKKKNEAHLRMHSPLPRAKFTLRGYRV